MDFAKDLTDLLAHGGWQAVSLGIAYLLYKTSMTGIITLGLYKAIVKVADTWGKSGAAAEGKQ